jgi:hypothetical protein
MAVMAFVDHPGEWVQTLYRKDVHVLGKIWSNSKATHKQSKQTYPTLQIRIWKSWSEVLGKFIQEIILIVALKI